MKELILIITLLSSTSLKTFSQEPVNHEILFKAFKQGARGNCASIALIKSSINIFGLHGVFTEKKLDEDTWEILLKNQKKIILSNEDIEKAKKSADFKTKNNENAELVHYAIKCYAVMAKMREKLEGIESFDMALKKLEKGYYTPLVYNLLGLENNVKSLTRFSNVENKCGIVAWRTKHAVYSCNGYFDNHGNKKRLSLRYYGRFQIIRNT